MADCEDINNCGCEEETQEEILETTVVATTTTATTQRKKKNKSAAADENADESDDDEPFETSIVEKRHPKTGEIIERETQVKIIHPELVVILRQGGLQTNGDKQWDQEPILFVSELIPFLPQLKTTHEQYMNQYQHEVARKAIAPLIKLLEAESAGLIHKLEDMTAHGEISFFNLWYLFKVGMKFYASYEDQILGAEISSVRYQKSLFSHHFVINGDVVQTDGRKFFTFKKNFSIPYFEGTVKIQSLPVRPMNDDLLAKLTERGRLFQQYGIGNHYLQYQGAIFRKNWYYTTKYESSGRVMVDCVSFQRMNPDYAGLYRAQDSYDDMGNPIETGFEKIPEEKLYSTWPFLFMFSFTSKKWGEGAVAELQPIEFDAGAFDRLVLPSEKKRIIKALVQHAGKAFTDVISGKGGGIILLLHGVPGVGKTLTAEALAELLQRPLYSISSGELGTDTDQLERRLREILEVSQTWKAVLLLDEADIFLERRTEHDIVRNAMVGIFLRLLEYQQGTMLLTTNRVKCFDEAFQSRISLTIKYDELDEKARRQVWSNLLEAAGIDSLSEEDKDKLATHVLNGRQIKNIVRLAQTLAISENVKPNASHFDATIALSQEFAQITQGQSAL